MIQKKIAAVVFGILVIAFLAGCGGGVKTASLNPPDPGINKYAPYPPPRKEGDIPLSKMNLYWVNDYVGLPGFIIGDPIGEASWIAPDSSNDFDYVDGRRGIRGVPPDRILQIADRKAGIEMRWLDGALYYIELAEGWKGQIQTGVTELSGIRIGSSTSDFLAKFPDAKEGKYSSFIVRGAIVYGARAYGVWFDVTGRTGLPERRKLVVICQNDVVICIKAINEISDEISDKIE